MPQQHAIEPSRLCLFRISRAKARIAAGVYDRPEIARVAVADVVEKILDEAEVDELLNTYWDERADDISEHDSNGAA